MTSIQIPLPDMDLNGDGKVTFGELVTGAFLIVGYIVLGINAASIALIGIAYVVHPWQEWGGALKLMAAVCAASIGIGMVIGAVIGIKRMLRPERGEREALVDRTHEREVKAWEFKVLQGVDQKADDTGGNAATQDHYARIFLKMSYDKGGFITRQEWTARGLSEDWWNRLNKLMQQYHIRHGKSSELQYATMPEAWGVWCDQMLKSRHWVKAGQDYLKE